MAAVSGSIGGRLGRTLIDSGRSRNQPTSVSAPIAADNTAQIHGN